MPFYSLNSTTRLSLSSVLHKGGRGKRAYRNKVGCVVIFVSSFGDSSLFCLSSSGNELFSQISKASYEMAESV